MFVNSHIHKVLDIERGMWTFIVPNPTLCSAKGNIYGDYCMSYSCPVAGNAMSSVETCMR